MNADQFPPQTPVPATPLPPQTKSRRRHLPRLAEWIVGVIVLLVLAAVFLPLSNSNCVRGAKTKALAQAKTIGFALKMFAGDHDGQYPRAGLPGMPEAEVKDSNAAFAMLFPTYVQNETIFGIKTSAYQTRQPDSKIDGPYNGKPVETLAPGENVYAYVAGLTDESDPTTPLVVDGTDGTGHYTTDIKKRGGCGRVKTPL